MVDRSTTEDATGKGSRTLSSPTAPSSRNTRAPHGTIAARAGRGVLRAVDARELTARQLQRLRSLATLAIGSRSVRRALLMRLVAAALCTGISLWAARSVTEATVLRAAWGPQVSVLVARHDIEAGDPVDAGDVLTTSRPASLEPSGALHELEAGTTANSLILAGEPLVRARLGDGRRSTPGGTTAISLELVVAAPELRTGDRVDVLGPTGPQDPIGQALQPDEQQGAAAPGIAVISSSATVLRPPTEDDPTVEVAVPHEDIPAVTEAALGGGVAVVRRSP